MVLDTFCTFYPVLALMSSFYLRNWIFHSVTDRKKIKRIFFSVNLCLCKNLFYRVLCRLPVLSKSNSFFVLSSCLFWPSVCLCLSLSIYLSIYCCFIGGQNIQTKKNLRNIFFAYCIFFLVDSVWKFVKCGAVLWMTCPSSNIYIFNIEEV